jgi:hypothetical protein
MPRFEHISEELGPVTFLGTWIDSSAKALDLYFRPKPANPEHGYCDAILARWGNGAHDLRVGPATSFTLADRAADEDFVGRAMRVGHLIAVDRGLMPQPVDRGPQLGERFQVQIYTGIDPLNEDDDKWVPALVDARVSTFSNLDGARDTRTMLMLRGIDPERLRVFFMYGYV